MEATGITDQASSIGTISSVWGRDGRNMEERSGWECPSDHARGPGICMRTLM